MQNRRTKIFLVTIAIGIVVGLFLGWSVFPREAADLPLSELRDDFKGDYVLMVATIYASDQDLQAARTRLLLIDENPRRLVSGVISQAATFADRDLQAIHLLLQALEASGWQTGGEGL